jgi:hypothetical protein
LRLVFKGTKEFQIESQSPINITKPATEELLSGNAVLRAEVTVQEILDWANTNKIPQTAVNELLQVLRVKRIKQEIKSEPKSETQPSNQRNIIFNLFLIIIQNYLISFY